MKKFLLAALTVAFIITGTATPAYAEEVDTEIPETVEVATEEATAIETEAATEEVTEEAAQETEAVDGAIIEQDYLSRMMEKIKDWFAEHPELVGSFTASGGLISAALAEVIYMRKSRKRIELKADDMREKAILLNNNAVELVETAKETVNGGKEEMNRSRQEMVKEIEILRMEVRAMSVLLVEMIKDARLPDRRKEEIIGVYNSERSEEMIDKTLPPSTAVGSGL
jgi:hypothetical protein